MSINNKGVCTMEKTAYQRTEFEIIRFSTEDVITTSNPYDLPIDE